MTAWVSEHIESPIKEWCTLCGTEKVKSKQISNKRYDEKTGVVLYLLVCNNKECPMEGCKENGGHYYGWKSWFGYFNCKQCGWDGESSFVYKGTLK